MGAEAGTPLSLSAAIESTEKKREKVTKKYKNNIIHLPNLP
jgi:hypothetical protein